MHLSPGTKIGPYEIRGPLGAGGMGEVYRAHDARLARDVAIKSLPADFAQDTERLARFEREAKLLASMSHPNIAGIFGIEEDNGTRYLVLELVEGETLAHHIARGPLPVDEALHVCAQVAMAVESAHDAGIIHRDLKPGNVMLTPDGNVKVLDFGLAKAGAAGSDPNLSASPTLSHMATNDGMILGTAAYMSPEQARGKAVDRRTDIWSFGCLLYECLTGRALFDGETVSDIIAKILQTEPDWQALPANTPESVSKLLHRCLTRNPKQRLRDIGEARIALETTDDAGPITGISDAPVMPQRQRGTAARLIAAGAIATVVAVVVTLFLSRSPAPEPTVLSVMLPRGENLDPGVEDDLFAVTSDGRSVAYVSQRDGMTRLFLRRLDQRVATEIPGTRDARNPFFSPDGEWVAYSAMNKLYKVSLRGGTPVALAEVAADRSGVWLDDGTIVYAPSFSSPLYRIDAGGGEPHTITSIDSTANERTHRWPCALPGGEWIVFTVGKSDTPSGYDDGSIEVVSLKTGERRTIARGSCARYAPGGHLILAREGSLYSIPLDPANPQGGATPDPVLDGVLGVSTSGIVFFDIARNGTLFMVPGRENKRASRLAWMDNRGVLTPLPGDPQRYNQLSLSSDAKQALALIGPGLGRADVFLLDLERGTRNQLTFDESITTVNWLPGDSQRMVLSRVIPGGSEIVMRSLLGDEAPVVLIQLPMALTVSDVFQDGSAVVFNEFGGAHADILTIRTDGSGRVDTLVAEPGFQTGGVVSPDGRWIAYSTSETGKTDLCVRPIGRPGGRVQITSGIATPARWSDDGSKLYYVLGRNIFVATMTVRGGIMTTESQEKLLEMPFAVTSNSVDNINATNNRFLVKTAEGEASEMREIAVYLNWAQSLPH